jgi:hypothetical protein
MTPAPLAAHRLPLLGCTLAMAAALMLSACGGDGAATAENTATTQAERQTKVAAANHKPCPAGLTGFVGSLDRLRRQLAIGLSYEQYAAKVRALKGSYGQLPIKRLTIDCLATIGTPAEQALNKYIDATNAWGECLAEASCTTATIEPILQRKWRIASRFLSEAPAG